MAKFEIPETTTITVDEQVLQVSEQSAEIQELIKFLDDWRQDEVKQVSALLKTRAALRDLQNSILQQLKDEAEKAASEIDVVQD